jgi:hypothetical protein
MRALVAAIRRRLAGEGHQRPPPLVAPTTELGETPADGGADEERHDDERCPPLGRWQGPWIAAATFVPTFLAIFFGLTYLAGLPMEPQSVEGLKGGPPPVVSALPPQEGFAATPPPAQAPMMSSGGLPMRAVGQADEPPQLPSPPTREPLEAPMSSTTPATPRPPSRPTRPPVEPKAAEPKRTVTKDDAWIRGAAFSNRGAAERLAASIEHQGYPARVRRDGTPRTPWVVWIAKQPKRMTPPEQK